MENTEILATQCTQDEEEDNNTTQYDTTIQQTQIM
jgi:hypothetical protein